jgi:NADH:ubiquinone reductase (H+-translocating)
LRVVPQRDFIIARCYAHLVLALGSVSNYLGMANIEKLAFNFKSLLDAIRIRNHVIEMFERADREADASQRVPLLSFVIAGGGFAGVELAGALNDFARGILADYPSLNPNELNIVLVHSRDRILPELSESLARYAQKKMEARGVEFRLNARLSDAQPGVVVVSDGEIRAQTLVWTAGTAPNPLLKSQPFECDKRGGVWWTSPWPCLVIQVYGRWEIAPQSTTPKPASRALQRHSLPFARLQP